ncbi:energy transducer TonB [Flexistipes sp.]|uniref:energy transducer TonB n=1 Tax=Flexistipes sp. TaxID=3088135 RepID=UPI002E1B7C55|nr:energy transducer TonB [Flexistipes sp.]
MKKYMFLPITLLLSIMIHLLILLYIPGFNVDFSKKDNETIEIELVKPKIKKPQETNEKAAEKKAAGKKEIAAEEKQLISAEKVIESADAEVSKTLPRVNLPKFKDESEISVQKPGFENLVQVPESKNRVNVSSEIASAKSEMSSRSVGVNKNKAANAGNNFFEIKSASNINRTLLKPYPEKPSFSLESNTTVTLSFYVDQNGNTYSITPVTRSDKDIEQLAIDYVSKLKFEAVSYNKPDKIQIKFYFKVE